jgi:hypothetical protein
MVSRDSARAVGGASVLFAPDASTTAHPVSTSCLLTGRRFFGVIALAPLGGGSRYQPGGNPVRTSKLSGHTSTLPSERFMPDG